jgi:phosphoglycerate dehydrogenase-like enzyme
VRCVHDVLDEHTAPAHADAEVIDRDRPRIGMRVVAYDLRPNADAARSLGYQYVTLKQLLEMADAVTLHAPAASGERHLLSNKEFAVMKQGAVLINTARGTIVDEQALVRALNSGRLAAAGLDVNCEGSLAAPSHTWRMRSHGGSDLARTRVLKLSQGQQRPQHRS